MPAAHKIRLIVAYTFLLIAFGKTTVTAQQLIRNAAGHITIAEKNCTITIVPYAKNVVKFILQPAGYTKNELVSDAVIGSPQKFNESIKQVNSNPEIILGNVHLMVKQDTIYFGDKGDALISTISQHDEYSVFKFLLSDSEKIFGGGERALPLNRRGYKFNLYNQPSFGYGVGAENLNYSVPFITSSNKYALFFDNPSKGYLDIGKANSNMLEYGAYSGQLNFYLIQGNDYADILSSYHALTGTQPIPPRWAFGNFLSRFGYTDEAQIKSIMEKMDAAQIPYSAVIFDLYWFGDSIKGTVGNLEWVNKKAWPNPQKMIADFKKAGTKTILITEPFVVNTSSNYTSSIKYHATDSAGNPFVCKEFYFGPGGLIDIFRKDSRDWFWSKYNTQMKIGVEAWWGDLGEPEMHPAALYHNLRDLGFKRLFSANEVHNIYGHYWTKMLFEKYAQDYPNKRLFSLNRSGFAGTQRYGIFPWTGDVSRSWSGFQAQLPVMLGMSMSGIPYVHSDAGGFAGGEKDGELYIRWLQFAAYTPIFRPHGSFDKVTGILPTEAALFDEPYKGLAKKLIENRYRLMPYNYTLAYNLSNHGEPLISPLYYYFSTDNNSYAAADEFMWGKNLLIAPVLQKGATTRSLYLPKGKWYDYKTFSVKEGGRWINDAVTLDAIPVYVKEGSFIVTNTALVQNMNTYSTKDLTITYFPSSKASSYTLYDDDGEKNNAVKKNKYQLINFNSTGWNGQTVINIDANTGSFNGKPNERNLILCIPGLVKIPSSISINGKKIQDNMSSSIPYAEWDETHKIMKLHLILANGPLRISIGS